MSTNTNPTGLLLAEVAASRIKNMICDVYTSTELAESDEQAVSWIVADLIHYCKANNLSLNSVYKEARHFVAEDLSSDAELVNLINDRIHQNQLLRGNV